MTRPLSWSRALTLALALLLALASAVVVRAPGAAAQAPVSASHPYSDPIWYPLRVSSFMDCVKNNPGCKTPHSEWMMDVVPDGQGQRMSRAGVYAMGAGIVRYGDASGARCGVENSYGTWIWIDHGAGTLSRYGHLSSITVRNGQYVAAGQQIGVVGTTGKRQNCHVAYTNFSIQHNGLKTTNGVEFKTLQACSARTGARQTWPTAISRYSRWNSMPTKTLIPASSGSCIAARTPATAPRLSGVAIARGKGKLRVAWKRPAASYRTTVVMVEISEWHTGGRYWDLPRNSRWVAVSASKTSVTVGRLTRNRLHRVRVFTHNPAGWSQQAGWFQRKTK